MGKKTKDKDVDCRVLRMLGTDARIGIDAIASELKLPRTRVYLTIKRLIDENEIWFVPEVNVGNVWKYEFLAESKRKKKREIQKMDVPLLGFEEYAVLAKFMNRVPDDPKVANAISGSYMPQYVGRTSGHYDLFMYLVARDFSSASDFMLKFRNKLAKYEMVMSLQPIRPSFGFFPISDALINQMHIQEGYKRMLIALNKDARRRFTEMSKEVGVDKTTVSLDYKRLQDIQLIERATYYMKRKGVTKLLVAAVRKTDSYLRNRDKWLLSMVKYDTDKYIYVAEITNPDGMLMIVSADSAFEYEKFKEKLMRMNLGIEIAESTLHQSMLGNIGYRLINPEYTKQYRYLENKGLVPKVARKAQVEETEFIDVNGI